MLFTKCIKAPISDPDGVPDGLRISVMSRHTLNDGTTPDPEITPDMFETHWPQLAPPPELIGSYYRNKTSWEAFVVKYLDHLRTNPDAKKCMANLVSLALTSNVTVMCVEPEPVRCHRRLLAEECKRQHPELEVSIS